jgi:glyoxylase-like metal-dependent hydrolase (beta-lactamase superfamily II)
MAAPAAAAAGARPAPTRTEVAPGVHVFQTAPYGDVGLDGNSVAIVSKDGVLVFDTNGTPAAAAAILGEIRALTDKPVKFIVNSHWHWDHWYGTEVYRQAFPGVQVIAQSRTRTMMGGPALEFNRPGIEQQLPGYIKMLEQKATGDPATQQRLDDARYFLEQKKNVHHVLPDVTFDHRLELTLGERRIEVLHHERAVTPGDTFVYLPDDRILITGDLLINPIPFALSSYPSGWLATLEKLDAFDAAIIIPGHGAAMRDETRLHATIDVFRELLKRGGDAKARGLDVHQARDAILPEMRDLVASMTNGEKTLEDQFRIYVGDWFLHRVYDELNGPLTDAIAPIPPG